MSSPTKPTTHTTTTTTNPSTNLLSLTESITSSMSSSNSHGTMDSDPLLFSTLNSTLIETKTWLQGLYTSPTVFTMGGFIHQLNSFQEGAHPRVPTSSSSSSSSSESFTTQDLLNHDLAYYEHSELTILSDATELQKVLEQCRFVLTEIYAKREAILKLSGEVWRTNSSQIKDLENALRKSTQEEIELNQVIADLESQVLDVAKTIEHKEKSILDRLDRLSLLSQQANAYTKHNDPKALSDLASHLTHLSHTCDTDTQTIATLESMLTQLTQESTQLDDDFHDQRDAQQHWQYQYEKWQSAWMEKQRLFHQRNTTEQTVVKNQYYALKALHQLHGIQAFQSHSTHFTIQFHSGVNVMYDAMGLHLNDWVFNEHTVLVHVFHSLFFHPPPLNLPKCQFDDVVGCWVKHIGSSFQVQIWVDPSMTMEETTESGFMQEKTTHPHFSPRARLKDPRHDESGRDIDHMNSMENRKKQRESSEHEKTEAKLVHPIHERPSTFLPSLKKITVHYLGMSETVRQELVHYVQHHCQLPSSHFLVSLCEFLESLDATTSTTSTSNALVPPPSSSSSSSSSSSLSHFYPPLASLSSPMASSASSSSTLAVSGEAVNEEQKEQKEEEEEEEQRRNGLALWNNLSDTKKKKKVTGS